MKSRYIVGGILLAGAIVFGLTKWQRPVEVKTIKMSYIPATCDLVNFIAQEKGYYKDEGVNVELSKFDTSNQVSDALLAGRIDVSGCFSYPAAFSVEAIQPNTFKSIRSIITSSEYPFLWIVAPANDQTIKSIKDLAGKKIGRFPGTTTEAQLKHALKIAGVDPNSVSMQAIAPPQQINALLSGAVDALYALEPIPTIAEEQGVGKKIENLEKYLVEPNYNALYAVTRNYYNNNKETVERIIKAQDRAVDFLRNNPVEARQILTKYTPLTATQATQVGFGHPLKSTENIDVAKVQEYADLLFNEGDLKIKVDTSRLFSN